jgi:pimeloyl-ACP methyl ester carboxylesterase
MTVPAWFTAAINTPHESRFVDVDGVPIHYLAWNLQDRDKPGLLFAHGFRAHARWWSFVAPYFTDRFRVVALDFSGMGDSGARANYEPLTFSRDILGVLQHAGMERATLVGHSFGGGRVARTCAEFPEVVERAVILDSLIRLPDIEQRSPPALQPRPKNIYSTFEAARARFRLVPSENDAAPYVLDYIGEHSLKRVDGGWTWKFDESFMPRTVHEDPETNQRMLESIRCPVTYMYGELSIVVSPQLAQAIVQRIPNAHGPIVIPQAHHHVMLDQPLKLIEALRASIAIEN